MLGISADDWTDLAWWEKQALTEGMIWEMERGGLHPHPLRAQDEGGDGTREFSSLEGADASALAALGVTVW